MKIIIIGGGIAGLSAALKVKQLLQGKPAEIRVLEAGSRFGGVIKTEFVDQCLLECGPDSMLTAKPAGVTLMKALGMENQIVETDSENRRAFIAGSDCLLPMPEGFRLIAPEKLAALAASPCLSLVGKMRAAVEPFVPRHPQMSNGKLPEDFDESLSSFVTRRLGKEALDNLAQPLFSGIYTADPQTLSMRATMPQFLEYEAEFGSVIRGLQKKHLNVGGATNSNNGAASSEAIRYSMFIAPERGMESLIDELVKKLTTEGVKLQSGSAVQKIEYEKGSKQWRVFINEETLEADSLIICAPAKAAAHLLSTVSPKTSSLLEKINYASSAVINFVVERENVLHPLDGFGFVVPSHLRRNIIAGSFSSVKFKGRAPSHLTVLRAFVGGALFPEMMQLSDTELKERAFADLSFYLSIKTPAKGAAYREAIVSRWNNSMPQYAVGHRTLVKEIVAEVAGLPGLQLCGAAYDGVGIPDCIKSANQAAIAATKLLEQPLTQSGI